MALQGMDRSLNSLNNKRNLKLPPIQGALPSSVYDRTTTWTSRKPSIPSQSVRTHVPRETIALHSQNLVFAARKPPQSRVNTAHKPVSFPLRGETLGTTVEVTQGQQFPKSYNVLPPIRHGSQSERHSRAKPKNKDSAGVESTLRIDGEERSSAGKSAEFASVELLSERRKERLKEKHKQTAAEDGGNAEKDSESSAEKRSKKSEEPRKKSAVSLLFLKCMRRGRRGGVCLENENTLVNITDQLKEIFLRRNMEEMYLI